MEFWHFHYSTVYYLTHPWKWLEDLYYALKYAVQRAFRGWDDTVIWGIDTYLTANLPVWLRTLKKNYKGVPTICFDDKDLSDITSEEEPKAAAKWEEALDKMIAGFEAAYQLDQWESKTPEETSQLTAQFEEGFELFHKYYFCLWD